MENNPTMWRKILENKVIQSEEYNVKESRRYNISVSINHHQDLEKMKPKPQRYNVDFLSY